MFFFVVVNEFSETKSLRHRISCILNVIAICSGIWANIYDQIIFCFDIILIYDDDSYGFVWIVDMDILHLSKKRLVG